jgi:hypothetical protein
MNNDALLSLYLDGSLSAEQRAEFERQMLATPSFAQEVRELETLQTMLNAPQELDERSAAFLRSVEDALAVSVVAAAGVSTLGAGITAAGAHSASATSASAGVGLAAGGNAGATATQATASSWISSLASSVLASATASTGSLLISASLALATIGGVGAATYFGLQQQAQNAPAEQKAVAPARNLPQEYVAQEQTPEQTQESANGGSAAQSQDQTTANEADFPWAASSQIISSQIISSQIISSQIISSQTASSPTQISDNGIAQTKPKAREYKAQISGGDTRERYAGAVRDYMRQLQEKEAANDRAGAALVEKSLGALLRQSGDLPLSRKYLSASFSHARALGLAELEGEARAEIALVEFAEGKPEQALETLQEALNILAAAKSPERERWQKEWEKLSAKIKKKN